MGINTMTTHTSILVMASILASMSCYLVGDTNMNWFATRQFCLHNNGHLAELETPEDILDLLPLFEPYVYDYSETTPTVDGWNAEQPDSQDGDEDCVLQAFRYEEALEWYDLPCNRTHFVGPGF